MIAALLTLAQTVERDVAAPFAECMQIGYALSAYGDWDKDGHADFLISAPQTISDSVPTVALVSGKTGGGLLVLREPAKSGELNWFGARLATHADIDGDARPEIVIGTNSYGTLVCSSKDGATLYRLTDCAPIAVADMDGDAHGDWIVRNTTVVAGAAKLELLSGKAGAVLRPFEESVAVSSHLIANHARPSTFTRLSVGRYANETATVVVEVVAAADATLLATRALEFQAKGPATELCATADLDRDGIPDLLISLFDDAVHNAVDPHKPLYSRVFLLSGSDLSTLRELSAPDAPARFGYSIASGADLNADGYEDQLVSEFGDLFVGDTRFRVNLYSGKDGVLPREHKRGGSIGGLLTVEFGCRVCFVGDTNADGTADYAVTTLYVDDSTTTDSGGVSLFSGKTGDLLRTWQ